jgi:dTDP-4-dehydrorhamnose 3,5-epimerase-like enzyme
MAYLVETELFEDDRGKLTVIEKNIPFEIKRVFYINAPKGSIRGNHRHKKTIEALSVISGNCIITCQSNKVDVKNYDLNENDGKCLVIGPNEFRRMEFMVDTSILVIASTQYDKNDYIDDNY